MHSIYTVDSMAHVGKKIEDILRDKHISVVDFAKLINTNRNNVYSIFRRESVDTLLLKKIGDALNYDFFLFLSDKERKQDKIFELNIPTYSIADKLLIYEEKIKQLEVENTLLKQRLEDKDEIIRLLKA